ncbi:MAG: NADH-quinone oxidoreductase subunit NuoF [Oscillospiraceae bacterium]|jgi:NADP-reducing hydrogenase subunit HndC|nr:NADH-quinone oxidoreductase subunit NuoF [Oscillospiraceae bacterium]
MELVRSHILVCAGTGCHSSKSDDIIENLNKWIAEEKMDKEARVIKTGCFGICALGPIVVVYPEGAFYSRVKPSDAEEIVKEHIVKGRLVTRLLYDETKKAESISSINDTNFYKHQMRIALRNCGIINPEYIDEYIAFEGYSALARALTEQTPQEIIDILTKSGLRGRGGAGFPTGRKWQFAHDAPGDIKYVACNADEGDPGAFMDRSVLEGDPHSVVEAMILAGYAIGANQGYVYIRAEYPIAVERLRIAIKQAKEYGFLGDNIFGTGFQFDLEIRLGAGAFVCGEETALITSIEGNRGEPRPRPPFPAVKGLFGKPTLLNNVETYANIPWILQNGWEAFDKIGTEKSKGTKIFALGGKIVNTGLVEVPMGTTLRTVVEDIGGGCPGGKKFKAAQTGGPSGGCIPASHIDTPIDYESLAAIGSMMGSGGLIIMDEDNCMVDIARYFLDFTVEESCGKCTPCRIGTKRMCQLLDKIVEGHGTMEDISLLEDLCGHLAQNSLCALGQTAPNPVLSTLHYFRDEYEAHVREKRCPAGICKNLLTYSINDKCIGCTACVRVCPTGAISGKVKEKHVIDPAKCIKCNACMEKCKFSAIEKG